LSPPSLSGKDEARGGVFIIFRGGGATTTFGGARLAIFAFAASLSRSSLFKRANMLFAGKTNARTRYVSKVINPNL